MKSFKKKSIGAALIGLAMSSMSIAVAAPAGTITGATCTATKIGNEVTISVRATYQANTTSKTDYQVNGFKIDLINNGNQQFRTTGLVSISPTIIYTAVTDFKLPYKEGSSLKSASIGFYNGGSLKASTSQSCSWK